MRVRDMLGIVIAMWGFTLMVVINSHEGMRALAVVIAMVHEIMAILLFKESKAKKDPRE